jgi:hypothetical protein
MSIDGKQLDSSQFTASHHFAGMHNLVENFLVVFYNLTRGVHSVKIDIMPTTFYNPYYPSHPPSGGGYGNYYLDTVSKMVRFTVNADAPKVSVLSPANENYATTDVPLTIQIDRPFSQITYSLDGISNIEIGGNITLTRLYYGIHSLTLHVVDTSGNTGDYGTFTFRVVKPEPFPIAYSMGIVIIIVLVLLGATVYILKRKR